MLHTEIEEKFYIFTKEGSGFYTSKGNFQEWVANKEGKVAARILEGSEGLRKMITFHEK